jgi:hypothetical protein
MVGPLETPSAGGLRLSVRDAEDRVLGTPQDGVPTRVVATLRALRFDRTGRTPLAARDSLTVSVTLRADGVASHARP